MNAKRRVSVVKVLRFLLTVAGVAGCLVAVTSAAHRQAQKKLLGVNLLITNEQQVQFISTQSLRQMLFQRRHLAPKELPLGAADINRFERIARSNPWIESAEVYVDNRRQLQVRVTQRVPVVRIFEKSGASYYLDTALQQLPLSLDYTHYTPVVTGVPALTPDANGTQLKNKIVSLVKTIDADSFWKQGVAEIAMNEAGEFEIIPLLGNHRILLGDTAHMAQKLHHVFRFYKDVMSKVGWERYTVLDVRYASQVVASPALPWKAPVDRALSNMNWVKTIVKEETPPPTGVAVTQSATPVAVPATPKPTPPAAVQTAPKPATTTEKRVSAPTVLPAKRPLPKTQITGTAAKPATSQKSFPQKPLPTVQKPKEAFKSDPEASPSQQSKKESPKAVLPGAPVQP